MKLFIVYFFILSNIYSYNNSGSKKGDATIDYCKKIDSLIKERYTGSLKFEKKSETWEFKFNNYSDRIISELEIKTKIGASYQFGFGGKIYCDTLFNEDIRRWSKFFNCSYSLPNARPTQFCDPIIITDSLR